MKISAFIEKNKIIHPLAVGFLSHLRVEIDTEMDEFKLAEAYFVFAGRRVETGLKPVFSDTETNTDNSQNLEAGRDARPTNKEKK